MNKHTKLKEAVLEYSQSLYLDKLVAGTSGNISVYDAQEGIIAITPGSENYMKMTSDSVILIDMDGHIIQGAGKPSSEWRMHTEIYRNRNDIKAVVHTHSPYATGFAVIHEGVPVILTEMVPWLKGDIPLSDFALPGTVEVGEVALEALCERHACLLRNHGVIAVGETLQKAYTRAAYVEDASMIYYLARTCGTPQPVPESVVRMMMGKS